MSTRPALDPVFAALADVARRDVLRQLADGPRAISELAADAAMSLPGFLKHVRVLEAAALITCTKSGRTVTCSLSPGSLRLASDWLAFYRRFWGERLDALGRYLQSPGDSARVESTKELRPCPPKPPRRPSSSNSSASTRPLRPVSGKPGPRRKR
jgi:DNA-binding transcriptional ArsR family regulator